MANYYDRIDELQELATWDDADDWEVDEGGIYFDEANRKFVFISASGCSCWDSSDFCEVSYNSIDEIESDLIGGDVNGDDVYSFNPSIVTAKRLIIEARKAWEERGN